MKIITVFFERKKYYKALLRVFEKSLISTMPDIDYEIIRMKKPENIDHKRDTAYAFLAAAEYVLNSNELIAVCDCDLMFLKSIEDIKEKDFDIAVTTRKKMKYNTGLWFYRPSKESKKFVEKWISKTKLLMEDFCHYEGFCWDWGGIDQASLYLTAKKNKKINLLELPCLEWNATQTEWNNFDKKLTRIVHIKSKLRLAVFGKYDIPPEYKNMTHLAERFKDYL